MKDKETKRKLPEDVIVEKGDIVDLFGTEKQKEYFNRTNVLQKKSKISIERTLDQYYDVWEEIKHPTKARVKAYSVGSLKEFVGMREDGRQGKAKSMLTETMEMHAIGKIMTEDFNPKSKSLTEWLVHLGLIHHQEYNLYQANAEGSDKEVFAFNNVMKFLNSESDLFLKDTYDTKYDYRGVLREYRYFIL